MSYTNMSRLKFCYDLLSYVSLAFMLLSTVSIILMQLNGTYTTHLWIPVTSMFIFTALFMIGIKRSEMYQNKIDEWDYQHYLDNHI